MPSIDCDHRTGDIGPRRGSEEQHCPVEIVRLPDAAQWNARFDPLARFGMQKSAIEVSYITT